MGAGKLRGTTTYRGAVAVPQTQTSPTYIQLPPILTHTLPIVHNVPTSMPSPFSHSHLERTDDVSAEVSVSSSKLDEADPIVAMADSSLVVPSLTQNNSITDVYMANASGNPIRTRTSNPFLTVPILHGPQGEKVRFLAIVDNGTMINAIDTAAFQRIA